MNVKKIMYVFLIFFIILTNSNNTYVYADKSIIEQGKSWMNVEESDETFEKAWVQGVLNNLFKHKEGSDFTKIAGMLQGIGIFVIAIVGVILGIRLMFADPNSKAKVKQAFIIYLIGSIIIFGALGIWKLMISILDIF